LLRKRRRRPRPEWGDDVSARKAKRRRLKRASRGRGRAWHLSKEDIENARLALIGVAATCELLRASYGATRSASIVLTRGALQPLREALELLGEPDTDDVLGQHLSDHRR